MHDGTTLTFRTPETIPNGLPAHEPRLVRATAESLADYGTIVTDPDNHKVEIVRWPALGSRRIDPNIARSRESIRDGDITGSFAGHDLACELPS